MVDVSTKDFPSVKTLDASISFGYTTGMHFNKNFVYFEPHSTDFIGFAGDRKLHFNVNSMIPDETENSPILEKISKGFSRELGVKKNAPSFLDQSYSLSYGNQFNIKKSIL